MNAGLLGEHLASPRTATKTNQNTALEPNKSTDSAPPSEDGFAAYVAKDTNAASQDAPSAEDNAVATASTDADSASLNSKRSDGEIYATAPHGAPPSEDGLTASVATDTPSAEDMVGVTTLTDATSELPGIKSSDGEIHVTAPFAADIPDSESSQVSLSDPTKAETPVIDAVPNGGKLATTAAGEIIDENPRTAPPSLETALANLTDPDTVDAAAPRTDDSIDARLTTKVEAQPRVTITDVSELEQAATSVISRETPTLGAEPTVTIGLASSGNTPVQANVGLTPTAAAIPVAAPSDLTSVILNAVKNGADPQEQLVVQLDPPELGRVMIDFKFDAQGVQQITVTSENPEALKRLRELHFELTQALRDNGLSDQNMSFRQEAGDQSQNAWQSPDDQRSNAPLIAAEDRRASLSARPAQPNVQARDRLDLLL